MSKREAILYLYDTSRLKDGWLRLITKEAQGSGAPSIILSIKKAKFWRILQLKSPCKKQAN